MGVSGGDDRVQEYREVRGGDRDRAAGFVRGGWGWDGDGDERKEGTTKYAD